MSVTGCVTNPLQCIEQEAGHAAGSAAAATVPDAWDAVCKSFADGADVLLQDFAKAYSSLPNLNPATAGIKSAFGLSLTIAGSVAALLVFGQVIRTAWTHDGNWLAQAVTGTAKAVVAWLATAAVATAALAASNTLTEWIIDRMFHSQQEFVVRLGNIVNWAEVAGTPGQAALGASVLLLVGVIGIVLIIVLWAELLLRNAALAILIALSPVAAAGQIAEPTKAWWQRTVSAAVQLIILKPVIALVFVIGFGMAGTSSGVEPLLEGLLVLFLGVFSWPVIARFFTFASIQSSSSGLATALGFVAGRMSSPGGQTAGVNPRQWSQSAEQQTMAGSADGAGGADLAGAPGAAPGGTGGTGPAGGTGGTGSAVMAGIGSALRAASTAGTMLAGRMEQTAGHAGMPGAYPYSTVGSGQRAGPGGARRPSRATSGTADAPPAQAPERETAEQEAPDASTDASPVPHATQIPSPPDGPEETYGFADAYPPPSAPGDAPGPNGAGTAPASQEDLRGPSGAGTADDGEEEQ